MTKTAKNPHNYLLLIWRGFWSNYKDTWGPDHPDWFRPLGRLGYNIFGSGNIQSGFISEEALKDKINGGKPVLDHYLSPQFAAGAMLEFQEKYLCPQHLDPRGDDGDRTNFENFCEYMNRLRVVNRVTKKQNKELSKLTETKKGSFPKVHVATDEKYGHLGIDLYQLPSDESLTVDLAKRVLDTQDPVKASDHLHFPTDLLLFEKRFM